MWGKRTVVSRRVRRMRIMVTERLTVIAFYHAKLCVRHPHVGKLIPSMEACDMWRTQFNLIFLTNLNRLDIVGASALDFLHC